MKVEKVNIPPIIQDMVGNMLNKSNRLNIRDNYFRTIVDIHRFLGDAIAVYTSSLEDVNRRM